MKYGKGGKATDGFKATELPKGHKGHTGVGHMEHLPHPHLHPQNHATVGKHGGKIGPGQHPKAGKLGGLHTFTNVRHPDHHSKMSEG